MSVLQERLMLVLSDTGRVSIAQSGLLDRLQQRWPTPHGYAPQSVEAALKSLREAGSVHCSPAGKWTRFLNLKDRPPQAETAPPADPVADEPAALEPGDDETTQEIEVSKLKVCTGKCGEEKPVDEFYAKCNQCKRCVLDRQKDLKAKKEKAAKPRVAAAVPKPKAAAPKRTDAPPPLEFGRMVRMQYQLVIVDTGGDKHEFMVDHTAIKRLQAELQEVA